MTAGPPPEAAPVSELSVRYSLDELRALGDLLQDERLETVAGPPDDEAPEVREAVLRTASRSLLARRIIAVGGDGRAPRVEVLEPHATLVAVLRAPRLVAVAERWRAGEDEAVSAYFGEPRAVERSLVSGAVHAFTLADADAVADRLLARLAPPDTPAGGGDPIATTPAALAAMFADRAALAGTDDPAAALVYAARATGRLTVRSAAGSRVLGWIDGGALGLWWLEHAAAGGGGDAARLAPMDAAAWHSEARRRLTA